PASPPATTRTWRPRPRPRHSACGAATTARARAAGAAADATSPARPRATSRRGRRQSRLGQRRPSRRQTQRALLGLASLDPTYAGTRAVLTRFLAEAGPGWRRFPPMDAKVDGLPEHEHRAHLRRAVIASTIGTAIEWYDFFLYSTVTGLVFAKLF